MRYVSSGNLTRRAPESFPDPGLSITECSPAAGARRAPRQPGRGKEREKKGKKKGKLNPKPAGSSYLQALAHPHNTSRLPTSTRSSSAAGQQPRSASLYSLGMLFLSLVRKVFLVSLIWN